MLSAKRYVLSHQFHTCQLKLSENVLFLNEAKIIRRIFLSIFRKYLFNIKKKMNKKSKLFSMADYNYLYWF